MPRLVSEGERSTANDAIPDRRGHRESSTRRMFRHCRNYIGGRFRFRSGVTTPNRCAQSSAVKGGIRTCRSAYHCRCYASESARQSCFRISAMEGAASRRKRAAPLTRAMVALGRHFEVPTRGFGSNGGTPAYVPATNAWKLDCARTRVRRYDEES